MTDKATLTSRQREILLVIHEEVSAHGFPPSVREIAQRAHLASPSTVKYHLDALERAGYLQRVPGLPRALRNSETGARRGRANSSGTSNSHERGHH